MQKYKLPFTKAVMFIELYHIALASSENVLHGRAMKFSRIDLPETSMKFSRIDLPETSIY